MAVCECSNYVCRNCRCCQTHIQSMDESYDFLISLFAKSSGKKSVEVRNFIDSFKQTNKNRLTEMEIKEILNKMERENKILIVEDQIYLI